MAQRDVLKVIWQNFVRSLSKPKFTANKIGEDKFGNTYFEIPADPSRGKRFPRRWFQTVDQENYLQEIPVEWEAWIRNKRESPPTEEELFRNQTMIEQKKRNAEEINYKFQNTDDAKKSTDGRFPIYEDYETLPGIKREKKIK
ncbi:Uncharacterised protein g2600 [Pycnogonum litorale]